MDVFDAISQVGADLVFSVSESDGYSHFMLMKAFNKDGRYAVHRAGPGYGYSELQADKEFAEVGRRVFMVEGLKAENLAGLTANLGPLQKGDCAVVKVPGTLARNKAMQEFLAASFVRKVSPKDVKPWEVNEWVSARLRDKGASFPATLPLLLARTVGDDLIRLEMEMDKLIVATGGKLYDGVMRLVNKDGGEVFQAMLEALAGGDLPAFMSRARALGDVIPVCRFLLKKLSELNEVSVYASSGKAVEEIASETGLNQFLLRKSIIPSAKSIGRLRTLRGLKEFTLLEQSVKDSPQVDPWKLLEASFIRVVAQ